MNNTAQPPEVTDLTEPAYFGQRFILSLLALGIAAILCLCAWVFDPTDPEQGANRIFFWVMAGMLVIAASCSPLHSTKQLDLRRRELTETWLYGRLTLRQRRRSIAHFTRVVLRHTAHEGEGGTTYSADVGLKSSDGGPILWLRSFPATEEGLTDEARDFARQISHWTGLPAPSGGAP